MKSLIIKAAELDKLLKDSKQGEVLLLDLSDNETYKEGSIPNAIYFDYAGLISGEPPFPHKLPTADKFAKALAAVGYDKSQHIVAFDDEFGLKAARLYWTLRMAGLDNFSLLNGGLSAWLAAGYQQAPGTSAATPAAVMDLAWSDDDSSYLASAEQINSSLANEDMFIWDARSYPEWTGEERYAERGGRIPTAQHLEWKRFLHDSGELYGKEELTKMLKNFLGDNKKTIVAYCQAHRRSAMAFLISAYVGISIKGYDGSWMEWGNTPSLPLESGND